MTPPTLPQPTRLVIVESPYAGDVNHNIAYARACMRDCILRGEAPFASHLLYTQPGVLDDGNEAERQHGILVGFYWRKAAHATVVYTDLGISRGMAMGILDAERQGHPVERRSIAETPVGLQFLAWGPGFRAGG